MKFKTELHCHCLEASACATINAEKLTEIYVNAGYNSVVLANHFEKGTKRIFKISDYQDYVTLFINAFEKFKKVSESKLNAIFGAELRFVDSSNDYLWFGANEKFLRENPDIFEMGITKFHQICKENGWLVVQAHPFRNGMKLINPQDIDGIEVFNGHKGHDSRNFIAELWADNYGLLKTSGTDLHYDYFPANGGILTDTEMKSMNDVIEVLIKKKYELIKW